MMDEASDEIIEASDGIIEAGVRFESVFSEEQVRGSAEKRGVAGSYAPSLDSHCQQPNLGTCLNLGHTRRHASYIHVRQTRNE